VAAPENDEHALAEAATEQSLVADAAPATEGVAQALAPVADAAHATEGVAQALVPEGGVALVPEGVGGLVRAPKEDVAVSPPSNLLNPVFPR
jgi:hypothetical protein